MSLGSLNSRSLNNDTINKGRTGVYHSDIPIADICLGEFNAAPVNSYELNGCRFFASLGVQSLLNFNQLVGIEVSGTVVTFQQEVELQVIISGTVASFSQNTVTTLDAGTAITITQIETAPGTFLDIHGWDAFININGTELPKDILMDNVVISKESNQNTSCVFKVRVTNPLDFINHIDGADIVVNYFDSLGGYRLFTGFVDSPEIDIINKTITIRCSDRREDLIKTLLQPAEVQKVASWSNKGSVHPMISLGGLGSYTPTIQGQVTSVSEYISYSLQTIPADLDFDAYNKPHINSWYAKNTADYTYNDSSVYYRQPELTWQDKGSIVNDITVEMVYTYPRLYHYQRPFTWTTTSPPATLAAGEREDGFSFPTVKMVKGAIEGANWKDNGSLTYVESLSNYWTVPTNVPNSTGGTTLLPLIYHTPIIDDLEITTASWDGSTRFAQNIQETFTLNVRCSASIEKYNNLTSFANYNLSADYNTSEWEAYKKLAYEELSADGVPVEFPGPSAVISNDSYYLNKDINRSELHQSIVIALKKANVQILAGHRNTRVKAQLPLKPLLELQHTVKLDTRSLICKGKLVAITHTLDLINHKDNSTEMTMALFRSPGDNSTGSSSGSTSSTIVSPSGGASSAVIPSSLITLGNHLGVDWDTTPDEIRDTWNGFVGNTIPPLPYTKFVEKFIVDTPSAPDDLRKLREVTITQTYEVGIPNDELDIIF